MNEFKFKPNERVRLKYEVAELYRRAFGGSEGVVERSKKDEVGFPMVLIKWDKDHWTYNGEEDMWTFEDHFERVEEIKMPDNDKKDDRDLRDALINFLTAWGEDDEANARLELGGEGHPEQSYDETVQQALESAVEGEAFMLISVKRDSPDSTHFILAPEVFSHYKSEEAGILLETQVSQIAAITHQDLAGTVLSQIMREQREDDGNGE